MIVGIGTDLCSVERFAAMLGRRPGVAERILTDAERQLSVESQAGRFAAKEALVKALGSPGGLSWLDAEVVRDDFGAPAFRLTGAVAARAAELGIKRVYLSIAHDGGFATAMVVAEQ